MGNAGKEADTVLHIKNMVCNRCIMAVDSCLKQSGLHPVHVELGTAVISEELTDEMLGKVRNALEVLGFELIDDRKSLLIEQIRSEVIKLVHYGGNGLNDDTITHFTMPDPLYKKDKKGWMKLYLPARTALVLRKKKG